MKWLSYIFPVTLARRTSPYNRDIRVVQENGKLKLLVNGSRQSGEYVQSLWQHAFRTFNINPTDKGQRILVLGVGGGTVISLLNQLFPKAEVDAVDIDQVILDLTQKYFGIFDRDQLHLFCEDAVRFVEHAVYEHRHYDLIICDLFIGPQIPDFVSQIDFIREIKKLLTKDGKYIINYLRELEYGHKSDVLENTLKQVFNSVQDAPIRYNRFFCATK